MLKRFLCVAAVVCSVTSVYAAADAVGALFPGLGKTVFVAEEISKKVGRTVAETAVSFASSPYNIIDEDKVILSGRNVTINYPDEDLLIKSTIFAPFSPVSIRARNLIIHRSVVGLSLDIKTSGHFVLYSVKKLAGVGSEAPHGGALGVDGLKSTEGDVTIRAGGDSLEAGTEISSTGNTTIICERDRLVPVFYIN